MKILVCDPISECAVRLHAQQGTAGRRQDTITPERLLEVIPEYHGMVVRSRTKVRETGT